jgi:serine-type D-Ala-D-Ala carboxypeptidase/endopeptidase
MAKDMGVQRKQVRVGLSRARKIVLSILSVAALGMAFLLVGNRLLVLVTGGNLGEFLRGEKYDKALPPVAVGDLQAVLDKDIAGALKNGELASSTGAGVSVAVVEHGVSRIFSYGAAKPDSIYEIGSITKTFTGLVLSQMVEQGTVRFDDPVRELLPSGLVPKPDGGEITLLSLATQHSGLPYMPDNFHPADPANPGADYRPADLYAFLAKHTVAKPAQTEYLYSNLGFGLLGQALSNRAGVPYSALLEQEVTGPLGMRDTVISLSPEQEARFIPGHNSDHQPAHAWDWDALAGCGAIRSTAPDMLMYLQANLHPENLNLTAGSSAAATLPTALIQSHQLRADGEGGRIALAWRYQPATGDYLHPGGTGGYSAYALFNPKGDFAVVVLSNTAESSPTFADRLGQHIRQRLTGERATSLAN